MEEPAAAGDQFRDGGLAAHVLVLNRHYTAIRVITARRAFGLLFKNFAEAIDGVGEPFGNYDFPTWLMLSNERYSRPVDHEQFVATPSRAVMVPRIIRLMSYEKVPRREVRFNRKNILARDEHRCQYCGRKYGTSHLSIDHVIPKSRGGKSTWLNVVAACHACNTRKGGRLPTEASMKLLRPPFVPKRNPLVAEKLHSDRYGVWRLFLGEGDMALDA